MKNVSSRMGRLLYLVPYVAKREEGVPVEELGALLDVPREQLLQDLEVLCQVGPPDGDPGEYLLVSVEEGRVYVDLPQRLTRPLRLTPAEGFGLLLGLRTLRESGIAPFDDALESAEEKLLHALGQEASEAHLLASDTVVAEPEKAVSSHLRALVTATRQHRQIEMLYKSETRMLDPYGIVYHAGAWYLVGHCHKRGDTRTFRIDRIAHFHTQEISFQIPADFDLEQYRRKHLYLPSADALAVSVHLDAIATARVGAHGPVGAVTSYKDGSSEIVIDCEGLAWVTSWVLEMGKHAKITGPEVAVEAMREELRSLRPRLFPSS